ncbi:hypothetical protein HFP72_02150 [Nocardiopsis sp. ARC36]
MSHTDLDSGSAADPAQAPRAPSFWDGRGELVIGGLLLAMAGTLAAGNAGMDVIGDGGLLGPRGSAGSWPRSPPSSASC